MDPGCFGTGNKIVGTITLVGSDKIRIVDAREWLHVRHLLPDLNLKGWLKYASAIHGFGQVQTTDIPSTDHEVIGMNHGQKFVERNVNFLASLSLSTQFDGRSHDQRAIVVGFLNAFLGLPLEITAIGNDSCSNRCTIITTPSDKHDAHLSNLTVNLEVVHSLFGRGNEHAILILDDGGGTISVLALDLIIGVDHVGRVDSKKVLIGKGLNGSMTVLNEKSLRIVCVGAIVYECVLRFEVI